MRAKLSFVNITSGQGDFVIKATQAFNLRTQKGDVNYVIMNRRDNILAVQSVALKERLNLDHTQEWLTSFVAMFGSPSYNSPRKTLHTRLFGGIHAG